MSVCVFSARSSHYLFWISLSLDCTLLHAILYAVSDAWSADLERSFVWQKILSWRSLWISASFSSNQSLCFLVERPPTFSAVSWRMVSAAATSVQDLFPGLAVPHFLFWPGAPLKTQFSSPASFFTCAPLFFTAALILSRTLVRTSLWSVLQSVLGMTLVYSTSHRSFWRMWTLAFCWNRELVIISSCSAHSSSSMRPLALQLPTVSQLFWACLHVEP